MQVRVPVRVKADQTLIGTKTSRGICIYIFVISDFFLRSNKTRRWIKWALRIWPRWWEWTCSSHKWRTPSVWWGVSNHPKMDKTLSMSFTVAKKCIWHVCMYVCPLTKKWSVYHFNGRFIWTVRYRITTKESRKAHLKKVMNWFAF